MARRNYSSTAQSTTLTADITNVATSVVVTAVTGWPASTPYTIVVDEDLSTQEVILVTARAGTTLTVTRAYGGTTGVSHTAGATVRHCHYSGDFDEANSFLNLGGTIGGNVTVTGSISPTSMTSSGAVSGTTGTFSGAVSGTTGSFSSAVSGTTGAFTGVVTHQLGAVGTPAITFSGDTNTGIYSPGADQIALVTNGVSRLQVSSAGLLSGTGTSLGAWTSWTPVLTGFTIGDGTATGSYCQVGKTIHCKALIQFGGTSSYTTSLSIALPVINASTTVAVGIGQVMFYDSSAAAIYQGYVNHDAGAMRFYGGPDGSMAFVAPTVPFTWASGDIIRVAITYELA